MGIAADFVLIVVAGLAGGVAARAIGLPLLVGYVVAGVVIGPHTAGPTVVHIEDLELLAEIGVALLLFALGLEVSFRDLRAVRRIALVGGPVQIVLTALFGTWMVHTVAGVAWLEAVWFGAMVSLSSTMVVLKTLSSEGTLATLASRVMLGLLVVQDLAVVPILIVLPQVGGESAGAGSVVRAAAVAAAFLVVMALVGTRLLPAILRRIVRWDSRELFLVAVVAAGTGVGFIAYQMGLSFAIGAFVAGMVLSESELSQQALSDVAPLRDIFGLLFFVTVGMLFDPRFLLEHAADVAVLVGAIVLGKALICGLLARAFGYTNMAPWLVGLGLSQIGEFSFVLARAGRAGRFITEDTYSLALTCTVLSMAVSPLVFPGLLPLVRRIRHQRAPATSTEPEPLPPPALENHVVVAGYGRTGRTVAGALQGEGLPHLIVERQHQAIAGPFEHGVPVVWGDITRDEILRAAGVPLARMLVMAVPDHATVREATARAKQLNPRLFVIARAVGAAEAVALRELGADELVQPEFEAGLEMVRRALSEHQTPEDDIVRITTALRHGFDAHSAD